MKLRIGQNGLVSRAACTCLIFEIITWNLFLSFAADEKSDLAVLTRIEQIRRLSNEEAPRGYPVRLNAVVTYADLDWQILFVRDETGGIFVNPSGNTTH